MKAAYKYQAEDVDELNFEVIMHTITTNVRLEFVEPSARKVFILWTMVERKESGSEWGEENIAQN